MRKAHALGSLNTRSAAVLSALRGRWTRRRRRVFWSDLRAADDFEDEMVFFFSFISPRRSREPTQNERTILLLLFPRVRGGRRRVCLDRANTQFFFHRRDTNRVCTHQCTACVEKKNARKINTLPKTPRDTYLNYFLKTRAAPSRAVFISRIIHERIS